MDVSQCEQKLKQQVAKQQQHHYHSHTPIHSINQHFKPIPTLPQERAHHLKVKDLTHEHEVVIDTVDNLNGHVRYALGRANGCQVDLGKLQTGDWDVSERETGRSVRTRRCAYIGTALNDVIRSDGLAQLVDTIRDRLRCRAA